MYIMWLLTWPLYLVSGLAFFILKALYLFHCTYIIYKRGAIGSLDRRNWAPGCAMMTS